jgi:phage tail-like protein
MADLTGDPATLAHFGVTIDGLDLGLFTACDGMSVEVECEPREEGGNNLFVHHLPTRMKFSNVKLTRPLNGDSAKVAFWVASMAANFKRTEAEIVAMAQDGSAVARWHLTGVIPVRWTGPSLNVETNQIATESLEIAHNGFIYVGLPGIGSPI